MNKLFYTENNRRMRGENNKIFIWAANWITTSLGNRPKKTLMNEIRSLDHTVRLARLFPIRTHSEPLFRSSYGRRPGLPRPPAGCSVKGGGTVILALWLKLPALFFSACQGYLLRLPRVISPDRPRASSSLITPARCHQNSETLHPEMMHARRQASPSSIRKRRLAKLHPVALLSGCLIVLAPVARITVTSTNQSHLLQQ